MNIFNILLIKHNWGLGIGGLGVGDWGLGGWGTLPNPITTNPTHQPTHPKLLQYKII